MDRKNYQLVYTAPLDKDTTLDEIYRRFNMEHPADYKGHSLSMGDIVVFRQDGKQTAYYVDEGADYRQVPEFFAQPEKQLTPDECMTGEQIQTPRGRFYLTDRSREQMEAPHQLFVQLDALELKIHQADEVGFALAEIIHDK